jgi:hypothetical protein
MIPELSVFVMAGLGPATHTPLDGKSVDDRDKPGHDEEKT